MQLGDLERDLERALAKNDLDEVAAVRRGIAEAYGDTPQGAEARYKLGLDALWRRSDLDDAMTHFRAAAATRIEPWAVSARTSLGLVLIKTGRLQQGVFELRKAAGSEPLTLLAAHASGLLVIALGKLGKADEAERAQRQHHRMLAQLTMTTGREDRALAHFFLGMELEFIGQKDAAREHLARAVNTGWLPEAEERRARDTLAHLG